MQSISMVAADLIKWVAYGDVKVRRMSGYNAQGAAVYIQLHQTVPATSTPTLAAGTVPALKSFTCATAAPFNFDFGQAGLSLTQLVVALSTTEPNYTAVGANGGLDLTLEIETIYPVSTEIITGDLATGRDTLTPTSWTDAEASSVKRLRRIDYTNNDGAGRVLLISADGGTTAIKNAFWRVGSGSTLTLFFGDDGLTTYSQKASDLSLHYGCKILQCTAVDPATVTSSAASYIRAIHTP